MDTPIRLKARGIGHTFTHVAVAAIGVAFAMGCSGHAEPAATADATPVGGQGRGTLPAVSVRPNFLVGRAIFEDGRPIPEFDVAFEGGFGGGGEGEGRNGRYEVRNQSPDVIIVRYAHARIHIPYRGKTYVLPLAPIDNKPDNQSPEEWRGDIQKGAARDFIFKLTGIQPGHTVVDPASVAGNDSYDVKNGFWGQTAGISLDSGIVQVGNTVEITLTPDGPLIDGSAGKTITRALHLKEPGSNYYLYDLPLGTYKVTARLVAAGAPATPLHLKAQLMNNPEPESDTPQSSVKITWTCDAQCQSVNSPTLTISR